MQVKRMKLNSLNDLNGIKKELFFNHKLKKINKKDKIKIARIMATGFEDIDLRKEPTKYQIKKANKIIKELEGFFNNKIKIIRPRKNNRKYYSEYSDVSKNFKYYPMQVTDDNDKFKIKNKKLKRVGNFSNSTLYKFKDKNQLAKSPKKAINNLFNEIKKEYKKEPTTMIRCGQGLHKFKSKDKKQVEIEINKLMLAYGVENSTQWLTGLEVFEFKKQVPLKQKFKKNLKKKSKTKKK